MKDFRRNIIIGYGIALILLITSAIASYVSINNLLYSADRVNQTNQVTSTLNGVLSALKDAETSQRGFLLTNNPEFLQEYHGAYGKGNMLLEELRKMVADNEMQAIDTRELKLLFDKRVSHLAVVIEDFKNGRGVPEELLVTGKNLMDQSRSLIGKMQLREEALLKQRTESMNRFSETTPLFIIIASAIAILITIVAFYRNMQEIKARTILHDELKEKDRQITVRLNEVEHIADEISSGNYGVQVQDTDTDSLGKIGVSLNRMSNSLNESFTKLKISEWQQSGIAELNEIMIGERNLNVLTEKVIAYLTNYTQAAMGALFLVDPSSNLMLSSVMRMDKNKMKQHILAGEGLAGQVANSGQEILMTDIPDSHIQTEYAGGSIKPVSLFVFPIFLKNKLKGVVELGTIKNFTPEKLEFLRNAALNIALAINSAKEHQRLEELLAETQAQSEELQAQHTELENINAELEAQAEKLQVSEEELKVQQEELQQANEELEERSVKLEEKNEMILQRNLEIQATAESLSRATKYKSEFLANMSHELRTPLNSILLLSRLLTENHQSNLSEEQVEYAKVIQSSGKGLLSLIDEILDLSKIEAGKMEVEKTDVALPVMLNQLESMFLPIAKEKEIELRFDLSEDLPQYIETDQTKLVQILRNLISNALKFTKVGSVKVKVFKRDNNVLFSVKDTGIGIPLNKHQEVFEAFKQADGSTRRQFGGTGLGLSISKDLANLLGGQITLVSEEGKGSEFILSLPLSFTVEKKEDENESAKENFINNPFVTGVIPAPVPDDRDQIKQNDKVILIIEDDVAFATALVDYAHKKGYKAVVDVRGDKALALAKNFKPRGILLDLQLPVLSGWQVMDALKQDPATRPIPVHMMSSYQVRNRSLEQGAIDFKTKPIAYEQMEDMFDKIEDVLNKGLKKVLLVESHHQHAKALATFLESHNVASDILENTENGLLLHKGINYDCVILDMNIPSQDVYELLNEINRTPEMKGVPIIIFTGKGISRSEEMKLKKYSDSIILKTAHSYQRILDEVSLFLHLVEENEQPARKSVRKYNESENSLMGKTVLIADDDVRNIFSISKSLEQHGMKVVTANDGKEAIELLEQNPDISLVLMDMMMPVMDGYEATQQIRKMPMYKNLTVIAITAKAMVGDREKCIKAGASDYITKPIDIDQLISLLRVWLYE